MLNPAIVIGAALLDSINPCAISVLLLTMAFLFNLGGQKKDILKIGLTYIIGIFITYILIGLGVLRALTFFGVPHSLAKLGSLIIISTGIINILGELHPNFPIKLKIPSWAHPQIAKLIHRGAIPAAFLLGSLVGLYEFPCTGGPYLLILTLLHDQAVLLQGILYLIFYNFIFVLPLCIILIGLGNEKVMKRFIKYRSRNSKIFAIGTSTLMIVLGFIILFTI